MVPQTIGPLVVPQVIDSCQLIPKADAICKTTAEQHIILRASRALELGLNMYRSNPDSDFQRYYTETPLILPSVLALWGRAEDALVLRLMPDVNGGVSFLYPTLVANNFSSFSLSYYSGALC